MRARKEKETETRIEEVSAKRAQRSQVTAKRARNRRQEILANRRHQGDMRDCAEEQQAGSARNPEEDLESGVDLESEGDHSNDETVMPPTTSKRKTGGHAEPTTKQSRLADPLEALHCVLEDESNLSPDTPLASRQMLAAVCQEVCAEAQRVPKAERHEFLASVLDMISEALHEIHDMKSSLAESSRQEAEKAAADSRRFEQLAEASNTQRAKLDAKKAEVAKLVSELSALKDSLCQSTECEKEASSFVVAAEKAERACAAEKQNVEAALKVFSSLESSGTPSKASEAKRMIKELEIQMDAVNVKTTLFPRVVNSIIPALHLKPEDRSSFEEGALAAAEGCFTNYLREKDDKLCALSREAAAARSGHHRARTGVEQSQRKVDATIAELKDCKQHQKENETAVREAERCRRQHKEEVAMVARTGKIQAKVLADFCLIREAFELRVRGT